MKRLPAILLLFACLLAAACAGPERALDPAAPAVAAPPADWDAAYWNAAMREAVQARERGDRMDAERACGRGMRYVEFQAVRTLFRYAELLDQQGAGVGITMRTKAQKLEQARDAQARAGKSSSTYLGFDPGAELAAYAQYLRGLGRDAEGRPVDELAAAYRYAQEVNFRRALIRREGKDPTGEC